MTNPYTPEKVAELVAEAQNFRHQTQTPTESVNPNSIVGLWLRTADALTAVTAERDTAIRDLDAGFAESDHLSAKYYQRMRDAEREMHARELHHFEEEQKSAALEADLARAEEVIAKIRQARSNHPECIVHVAGDPVTCGWKRAVQDIDAALTEAPA